MLQAARLPNLCLGLQAGSVAELIVHQAHDAREEHSDQRARRGSSSKQSVELSDPCLQPELLTKLQAGCSQTLQH